MDIQSIDVTAFEWFDKQNGNSYFAGTVAVNYGTETQQAYIMPFQYGYGSHYETVAAEVLRGAGLPIPPNAGLSHWCRENGVVLRRVKHENCKKRELMALTPKVRKPTRAERAKTSPKAETTPTK